MSDRKPRHRSGYSREETLLVRSACLTVAVTLGSYLDDFCIVGGLVPTLLIDLRDENLTEPGDGDHPGTNDLDIGLALALLDDERYAEVSERLRQEDFEPDEKENGNKTRQTWRHKTLPGIKVDFLIPPASEHDAGQRIQSLEADFGAIVTPGLELAFDETVLVQLDGHTLKGERVKREIPVCGPAAFVVLKALAIPGRGEPKDSFDLVYVIRGADGRHEAIAERLAEHARSHPQIVERAIAALARDFATPENVGPRRAAEFGLVDPADFDNDAADAHGRVDDLLTAYRWMAAVT